MMCIVYFLEGNQFFILCLLSLFVGFSRCEFPDHSDRLWEAKSNLGSFIQNLKFTPSPISQNSSIIVFIANLPKVSANATAILDI